MNLGKASLGLIVIFVGVFILLNNLGIVNFSWSAVIYFWPILIILAGINILLPKRIEGQLLSIMATIIVLLFFAYQGLTAGNSSSFLSNFREIENTVKSGEVVFLSEDYNEEITEAKLKITGGALEYTIKETSAKLIDIETYSSVSRFLLSRSRQDGNAVGLQFSQQGDKKFTRKGLKARSKANIRLNPNPIWDIELEIGAGVANLDLTAFKVRKLEIEGGVSSIKVKMGMPVEALSKIDFEGGVSSLEIDVPAEAGCIIYTESALSSLNFPGFTKQEDGSYQSHNYVNASKRIEIKLENGLSSISINRY